MGMWMELGVFGLVLVFGIWQMRDLANERRKREEREAEAASTARDGQQETPK